MIVFNIDVANTALIILVAVIILRIDGHIKNWMIRTKKSYSYRIWYERCTMLYCFALLYNFFGSIWTVNWLLYITGGVIIFDMLWNNPWYMAEHDEHEKGLK